MVLFQYLFVGFQLMKALALAMDVALITTIMTIVAVPNLT